MYVRQIENYSNIREISHLTVIAIQVSAVVQDHALKCFAKEFPYISDFSVAKYLITC